MMNSNQWMTSRHRCLPALLIWNRSQKQQICFRVSPKCVWHRPPVSLGCSCALFAFVLKDVFVSFLRSRPCIYYINLWSKLSPENRFLFCSLMLAAGLSVRFKTKNHLIKYQLKIALAEGSSIMLALNEDLFVLNEDIKALGWSYKSSIKKAISDKNTLSVKWKRN